MKQLLFLSTLFLGTFASAAVSAEDAKTDEKKRIVVTCSADGGEVNDLNGNRETIYTLRETLKGDSEPREVKFFPIGYSLTIKSHSSDDVEKGYCIPVTAGTVPTVTDNTDPKEKKTSYTLITVHNCRMDTRYPGIEETKVIVLARNLLNIDNNTSLEDAPDDGKRMASITGVTNYGSDSQSATQRINEDFTTEAAFRKSKTVKVLPQEVAFHATCTRTFENK